MISEADHIHNKAIFDCVNEAMNQARPYGVQGEPMPWSNKPRKNIYLNVQDNLESIQSQLEKVLDEVKSKVLSWASTYAGSSTGYDGSKEVDKLIDRGNRVSEKQIERIIKDEVDHSDDKEWQGCNDNIVAQVKMELADRLLDHLVGETVGIL